jgi:hypothetical protein
MADEELLLSLSDACLLEAASAGRRTLKRAGQR